MLEMDEEIGAVGQNHVLIIYAGGMCNDTNASRIEGGGLVCKTSKVGCHSWNSSALSGGQHHAVHRDLAWNTDRRTFRRMGKQNTRMGVAEGCEHHNSRKNERG